MYLTSSSFQLMLRKNKSSAVQSFRETPWKYAAIFTRTSRLPLVLFDFSWHKTTHWLHSRFPDLPLRLLMEKQACCHGNNANQPRWANYQRAGIKAGPLPFNGLHPGSQSATQAVHFHPSWPTTAGFNSVKLPLPERVLVCLHFSYCWCVNTIHSAAVANF